jgi:hypothetical protein
MPTKNKKASVLAFSLIILGIIIMISLSISLVSIRERKASMSSGKSTSAFLAADTGVEKVLNMLAKTDAEIVGNIDWSTWGLSCSGGEVKSSDGGFKVELKNKNGEPINCVGTTKVSEISSIKSIGTGNGQQRAIEAAVAAGGSGITGGCTVSYEGKIGGKWGNGCASGSVSSGGGSNYCTRAADSGYDCGATGYFTVYGYSSSYEMWICACLKK